MYKTITEPTAVLFTRELCKSYDEGYHVLSVLWNNEFGQYSSAILYKPV